MAGLTFKHIYKEYVGGKAAVSDFCLDVADGEFVVIVGPSGCGKTTTLRMVAGLESITRGELYIDGRLVNGLKPHERGVEMVFQDNALFPQMTVYRNIAFGLEVRKEPRSVIDAKVNEAAEILGIADILQSRPAEISGGQRRRVALGRALVREPKVFLLDEPLSGLDAQLRSIMRGEIVRLHRVFKTTFIYVTHDQAEAMTMGDRIAVMDGGRLQQVDTPSAVYERPINRFTAGFLGSPQMSFFSGGIHSDGQTATVEIVGAEKTVVPAALFAGVSSEYKTGGAVVFGFRPDGIACGDESGKYTATAEMTVSHIENLGAERYIYGEIGGKYAAVKAAPCDNPASGERITVKLDLSEAHVFDEQTGRSARVGAE